MAPSKRFAAVLSLCLLTPAYAVDLPGGIMLTGTVDQFNAACKNDLDKARGEIARLKAMKTPRRLEPTLRAYDNARLLSGTMARRAELAQAVAPEEAMRSAGEQCGQAVSTLETELSLDRGVYDAIAALDLKGADQATRYLVRQTLAEFRLAGVDRDAATRARVATLNDALTRIGQEFNKNIAQGQRTARFSSAELDGLPEDYKKAHPAGADGMITLTTSYPDYFPFIEYARNPAARERFYRAYAQRAWPENIAVLKQMIDQRHALATLLGYKHYADYITANKMIGNAQNAADFIARISDAADARMKADYAELLAQARLDNPAATAVPAWDWQFYSERLRKAKYHFDSQSVRPYFEYRHVKDGLFGIVSAMYGVQFKPVNDARVWDKSVEVYDIVDGKKPLGRIYLDNFPRANKYSHAANFFLTFGRAGTQLPEMVLVCNLPDPAKGPALMDHGDVRTLFHEFGHTMHLIFAGQPKWANYNFQWDFIEAPSQMFEEWTVNPATLKLFAKHYQTGETLPTALIEQLRGAEEVGKGVDVRKQMNLAALSLELFRRDPQHIDSDAVVKETVEKYTPFAYVPDTHGQAAFGHLESYSAFYYTYMWSLVIARDMLTEFEKGGLMDRTVAAKYRKEVLTPGASKPAADLLTAFLGRPYNFDAYQRWLDKPQ